MIVQLSEQDVDEMLSLQDECRINHDLFLPTSREGYLRAFQYMNFCYGYRTDGILAAFLNCSIPTRNGQRNLGAGRIPADELDQVGHMNTLLVSQRVRKKGIGRDLVHASLLEFRKRGCRHIYVTACVENTGSTHLLERMEFSAIDEIVLQGEKRILFYLDLIQWNA